MAGGALRSEMANSETGKACDMSLSESDSSLVFILITSKSLFKDYYDYYTGSHLF